MKVVCPHCGRTVGCYVPKGGNGTAVRPSRHNLTDRLPCPGRFATIDISDTIEETP